ncbi:MAG TPA: 4-alpha-glucanotransferase [Thermoanaerobaculia bacterium]|nr:4-alpha-glucanotransferase [Thermoanaerobaculia bacterium]
MDPGAGREALAHRARDVSACLLRGRGSRHDHARRPRAGRQSRHPRNEGAQFAFSEDDSVYLPHRHVRNCVVYTGTHDNDTARGWFARLEKAEKERVRDALGVSGDTVEWDLIRAAYGSVADSAIVPLQDVFGLGSEARMNTPGRAQGNWSWRARPEQFTERRAARLRRLAEITGRSGPAGN